MFPVGVQRIGSSLSLSFGRGMLLNAIAIIPRSTAITKRQVTIQRFGAGGAMEHGVPRPPMLTTYLTGHGDMSERKHWRDIKRTVGGHEFQAVKVTPPTICADGPRGGSIVGMYRDFTGEWVEWVWELDGDGGQPDLALDWT